MSDIAEKIRAWDESDDRLIFCYRAPIERSDATCELCGAWIAALPESRMKARQPGWHLICRECVNLIRAHGAQTKFEARYETSEQAKKVLPR